MSSCHLFDMREHIYIPSTEDIIIEIMVNMNNGFTYSTCKLEIDFRNVLAQI